MDILDQILAAQKGSRDEKIETFRSLFAEDDKQDGDPCWKGYKQVGMKKKNGKDVPNCVPEETTNPIKEDNVTVKSANAKAKQIDELEKLKTKHETEIEALKDRHERENDRLKGAKEKETEDDAIGKKRDALRKANEEFGQTLHSLEDSLEEGKLVSNIQHVIDTVMGKISKQVGKEIAKNQEKGLGMLNTLGSFVGATVSDKKQDQGKLFLKFGEEVELGERHSDVMRKRNQSQQKAHQKAMMKSAKKSIKDYDAKNKNKNEEVEIDEETFYIDFLNKKKGFKQDRIKFKSHDAAVKWAKKNFDRFNSDMIKTESVKEGRNYKSEYENYHKDPEQIKRRAKRNEARRMLKNRKDIKGKDVHHKDNNPMNNDKSNLSIVSQKFNRTEPRLRVNAEWVKAAAKNKNKGKK
jgi:hypothetical protein